MLSVENQSIILSVVMPNVIMLSVADEVILSLQSHRRYCLPVNNNYGYCASLVFHFCSSQA